MAEKYKGWFSHLKEKKRTKRIIKKRRWEEKKDAWL